eukprot:2353681-Pyramimonas_sp.AAC.1
MVLTAITIDKGTRNQEQQMRQAAGSGIATKKAMRSQAGWEHPKRRATVGWRYLEKVTHNPAVA